MFPQLMVCKHMHERTLTPLTTSQNTQNLTYSPVKQSSKTWGRQLHPSKVDLGVEQAAQWHPKVFAKGSEDTPCFHLIVSQTRPAWNTPWPRDFIRTSLLYSLITLCIWFPSSAAFRTPSQKMVTPRQKMVTSCGCSYGCDCVSC